MVLFIISVGLTITMGLMRVVNLAHGGFAMIGGYVAAMAGRCRRRHFIVAACCRRPPQPGYRRHRRDDASSGPLYRKGELAQVLLTIGMVFVVTAAVTDIFGGDFQPLRVPDYVERPVDIGFRTYPAYRLFLIAVGRGLALVLWYVIEHSLFGARLRAAVDNPRMARAVGINVNRLFTATFVDGCALAGFGGAVGAGHPAARAVLRAAISRAVSDRCHRRR